MHDPELRNRFGLVSRVVPAAELLDNAMEMAKKIASFSKPVGMYDIHAPRVH